MYLWRHTSEHQQVTDFVIAFLNKADIGRNGYCSRDINLQSKKVFRLFISPVAGDDSDKQTNEKRNFEGCVGAG